MCTQIIQTGLVRVFRTRTGFGKLKKLIMKFPMTWDVLEKGSFQNGYGIVLDCCLGSSKTS